MTAPHGEQRPEVQPIETCTATARSGSRCRKRPEPGMTVCRMHGGATRQAREAARLRLLEAKVQGELERREIRPVVNPVEHLAELGGEVLAWHDLCRTHLQHLRSWDYTDLRGVEDVRALIALYERSLERAVSTMERMARLGLDAETLRQQLRIEAERPSREQAAALDPLIRRVIDAMGPSAEQRAAGLAALTEGLQELAKGTTR